MTSSARVTEFSGENFTGLKSNSQLSCNACCKEIGFKKTIENNVKLSKHASGKEYLEKKESKGERYQVQEYGNQF